MKIENGRAYNKDLNSQMKEKKTNQLKLETQLSDRERKYFEGDLRDREGVIATSDFLL